MSTVITLACIALLAYGVYHYLPPDRPRRLFRLEQFRPAAPLAGILDEPTDPEGDGHPHLPARPTDQSSPQHLA
ncbi:hypothetical protein [Prescottella sp. R16]|uniref:hypothetical protein n=1 Tax=Prescottella sp. R16 TaxID=3064529 RepID=UPI00272E6643|nr:hypothetical protein [Prescottella sp. R16]